MGYAGFRRCAPGANGAALHDVVDVYAQPCAVGSIERECAFECFGQAGPVLSAGSQVDNGIACAADLLLTVRRSCSMRRTCTPCAFCWKW